MKKEAKLSASEVPGEVVGSGEEDLRCRSLLTVCQRRLGKWHLKHPCYGPVSLYVCVLSQVGVLLKRLNVGSHKQ